ncbi:CGNR zinc finger domain-containing protein [Phycicoccus sonneratiae]|uniref:CGNR zinc finger domain-containing protein n=1 Tax=Phycicoccus sonneratiae TaxID=2807628 RepID=A0ABS2CQE5_9MICO|nr:CGNR zinc finger domain-containing protein [Phycicoccus sonneraticus]MBM6402091.1 CGNR zinc finger domain-containing protein [Phycicoccus sonneraticus]
MVFTADTDLTLTHAAAVANTGPGLGDEDREELPDVAALGAWFDRWEWTGRRPSSRAELEAVHALRPRLRRLWSLREDALVDEVNALLAEGGALPRLVRHGDIGWHVHATSDEAPIAQRIAVEVGMALVDVIRAGEVDRLRTCAGEDCEDVLVDLSRNRSRKFCDGTCGTRANVAAYRARKAAADS